MKRQGLSDYLARLKSAIGKNNYAQAKRTGEAALKKLPRLSCKPEELSLFYYRFGYACHQLAEYSRALDFFYKSHLLALKHRLPPLESVYALVMMGNCLLSIRAVKQAFQQLQKVEQYYQKYGPALIEADKLTYLESLISLAYCYLQQNDHRRLAELLGKIRSLQIEQEANKMLLMDYLHLRGEYETGLKEYSPARQSFQECVTLGREIGFPRGTLEAKIHLAIVDLLEDKISPAISNLKSVLKESRRLKLNDLICESGLLLSKGYFLSSRPVEAMAIEKRIKPILKKLDIVWLYEKTREFETLYHQLQRGVRTSGVNEQSLPAVLVQVIQHHGAPSSYHGVIIGRSLAMQELYKLVDKISPTDLPVLIQGETGTGKELVAHAIHARSLRVSRPWLAFNCGAIPEPLIESELFGHTRGAFTGAHEEKKGYIELASGGTLFIDEIGNMSPGMQQKLLRVLEEKLLWCVGAQKPVPVDTRFLFASNQDMTGLVRNKLFREDLFYRINTIVINLPPLRDRPDDIPLLIQHFLGKYSPKTQDARPITPDALRLLTSYLWPGNVRELENELQRILVLHPEAKVIAESMLSESIRHQPSRLSPAKDGLTLKALRETFERNTIIAALQKYQGNINRAAHQLGYALSPFYRKMRQLGIPSEILTNKSKV